MSGGAHVDSFEVVRDFRAAVATFADEARDALAIYDLELRRTLDWLLVYQPQAWQQEIRNAEEAIRVAKIELGRCRSQRLPGGGEPSCMEEKKILERAKRRHQFAEEKLIVTRKWGQNLQSRRHAIHQSGKSVGRFVRRRSPARTLLARSCAARARSLRRSGQRHVAIGPSQTPVRPAAASRRRQALPQPGAADAGAAQSDTGESAQMQSRRLPSLLPMLSLAIRRQPRRQGHRPIQPAGRSNHEIWRFDGRLGQVVYRMEEAAVALGSDAGSLARFGEPRFRGKLPDAARTHVRATLEIMRGLAELSNAARQECDPNGNTSKPYGYSFDGAAQSPAADRRLRREMP